MGINEGKLYLRSGSAAATEILNRFGKYSAARPVKADVPVYDQGWDMKEGRFMKEDGAESEFKLMPFHKASPWPNLALKSPIVSFRGIRLHPYEHDKETAEGHPSELYGAENPRFSSAMSPYCMEYFNPY